MAVRIWGPASFVAQPYHAGSGDRIHAFFEGGESRRITGPGLVAYVIAYHPM